ncbi:YMR206W and YNR014W [Zygosaccharomyces parabailii]|nr:YMR206W and YNR014W [Zygosaccharomyces parabailii]
MYRPRPNRDLDLFETSNMPCSEKPVLAQVRTRYTEAEGDKSPDGCCSVFTVLDLQDSPGHQGPNLSDFSQCRSGSHSPSGRRVSVCSCSPSEDQEPMCNCTPTETQASPCDRHHRRRHSIAVRFEKSTDI